MNKGRKPEALSSFGGVRFHVQTFMLERQLQLARAFVSRKKRWGLVVTSRTERRGRPF